MSILSRFRARGSSPRDEAADQPVDLAPDEFLRRRTADAPVLDVRTAAEFTDSHLEGARNVDILENGFMDRIAELGLEPAAPVFLYCRSGNRSGHAARILRRHGYARAFNVGGLDELVDEGARTAS
jgi:phage shock protein E